MLKLVIFCALGIFIFKITSAENLRSHGIAAMKRQFEIRTKENNLTCENYLNYCREEYKSPDYNTTYFRYFCEVGIKGYLCDNAKDGEPLAQLYDKIYGYINDDNATEYSIKTSSGDYVVNKQIRSSGITAMKSFFENRTKEKNLTCDNYLDYCVREYKSDDDEKSYLRVLCEIGIKGYLCDNAKDGEAFEQLYDKVSGYIYDTARGRGPFDSPATITPPPHPTTINN